MEKNEHCNPIKPPKRLFQRIIERLKIEKSLKMLRKKLGFSATVMLISAILTIAAVFVLNSELAESESISLISLLFSDTLAAVAYYNYFILAVLESMPIISIAISLAAIVLAMIFLRLVVAYYGKILSLNKLIKK